jgi:hypothetical protein
MLENINLILKISGKLQGVQRLERKEKQLRSRCKIFTKQAAKYKDIIPLTEDIAALGININELLALKIGINQASKYYNLPFVSATMQLIDGIKNIIK